jgi:mannan endo-1,4-beta-mannosidase
MPKSSAPHGRRPGRAVAVALAGLVVLGALGLALRPALFTDLTSKDSAAEPTSDGGAQIGDATEEPQTIAPGGLSMLPTNGRYFGVSVPQGAGGDAQVADFSAAVGVAPTVQSFFQSFNDGFDSSAVRRVTTAGRVPMLTWEPFDNTAPQENPYSLQAIAAGTFDDYLRAEAAKFAAVDGPLVIRFAHEMNGNWYPWGQGVNDNTPIDYVAAYRHVHDVVTTAGATNLVWTWTPNFLNGFASRVPLAPLYPGDDVVDWVGVDGYYSAEHESFRTLFSTTLTAVDAIAPDKPILLAETAVARTTNRTAQISELVEAVATTPRLVGLVWSEFDAPRADWRVGDDPTSAATLGKALAARGFGPAATG